jgi:hypothetical protein
MESVEQQAKLIVFGNKEVAGSSPAPVCFCEGAGHGAVVQCKRCLTDYHMGCVAYVVPENKKARKYECGFCSGEPDGDGVEYWDGVIGDDFVEALNRGKIHRHEREVITQGRGKMRKRIGEEQHASWANVRDRVRMHANIIHLQKKEQYERAKARIKEGGHHVVDRAGGGGVQDVPLVDVVVDYLEGVGEI